MLAANRVLVLNAGSSTVKLAVLDLPAGARTVSQAAELAGGSAMQAAATTLRDLGPDVLGTLTAVGHRVVHGGDRFVDSVLIDDDVRRGLRELVPLAPLHLPAALAGMDAARDVLPGIPQVAVFDTGFHHTLPPRAFRYAVPQSWYDDHGARRFGFHGISVRHVVAQCPALLDRPLEQLRLVVAHLGNGCSATAVLGGRSVDTTMGFTPLEGLVMGTRSGDVDAGLLGYLAPRLGLDLAGLVDVLNTGSGLAGLSGVGNDMRAVTDAAAAGSAPASLALAVFTYRLAKAVAALTVPLGGLDALVFTGGIGQHSSVVRSAVLADLAALGLTEDAEANAAHGSLTRGRISATGPAVLVVPTDEELVIARDTAALVGDRQPS